MLSQKRILVCPLDWGLGHATRCIPIIRLLLQNNAEVIVAGDGNSIELLKKEFPQLKFLFFKGYIISYPQKGNMILKMLFSIPKILARIIEEHETLKKIIKEKNIDVVISDNRYGLWNKEVKSIFITHQLMIKTPFAEKLLHSIVLFFVNKYDECWIPDVGGEGNLSGDLSHKYPLPKNAFYVGALSRFNENAKNNHYEYDVMAIVSGPEPQRSIFEKILLEQLKSTSLKALVVCGNPQLEREEKNYGNIKIISHFNTDEMQNNILKSKIVIARSGYSTIMDLATLGKKAVFIPTPGQTEQEYLAERFEKKNVAFFQQQSNFDLPKALDEATNYSGFEKTTKNNSIEERIYNLLK